MKYHSGMFNKFYNHPYMHKIILQVLLSYGLPLYIALIPQSKALYYTIIYYNMYA